VSLSFCVLCDSATNPCVDHPSAARYLDDIVYERSEIGWKVPDGERERWEMPVLADAPRRSQGEARSLQSLIVELDAWVFLSNELEATVRAAYAVDARRTTRLVEKVAAGARDQSLSSPDGYLAKHARELLG
jgi:hypothetical protein